MYLVQIIIDKLFSFLDESSMSCNDDDTDNGSQKDQDPQMPVLRLPIPVSPSNENGNANIEAPALILHPGGRVSPAPMNENGRANIDARERILDIEEDRDMGGVGGDEKSEDEAERSYVVQRRSRRKRVKSSKLNGFADEYEEFQSMNEYGETDDEGFLNAADETFEVDVVSNTQEENDEQVMRSDRKKRVSSKPPRRRPRTPKRSAIWPTSSRAKNWASSSRSRRKPSR